MRDNMQDNIINIVLINFLKIRNFNKSSKYIRLKIQ